MTLVPTVTFMLQLNSYHPIPYTASQEPVRSIQTVTGHSYTAVLIAEVKNRDVFLGVPRCVICGYPDADTLKYCHIVNCSDIAMVCHMCSLAHMQDHLMIPIIFLVVIAHTIGMGPSSCQRVA